MKKVLGLIGAMLLAGSVYAQDYEADISSVAMFTITCSSSYPIPIYTACNSTTDFKLPWISTVTYMGDNDAGNGYGYYLSTDTINQNPNFNAIFKVINSSVNFRGVTFLNIDADDDIYLFPCPPQGTIGGAGGNTGFRIKPGDVAEEKLYSREMWAQCATGAANVAPRDPKLTIWIDLKLRTWKAR